MGELEAVIKAWSLAYQEEVLEFSRPLPLEDSSVFASVYHALIHSPLSATLLQLEASYALAVESLAREKEARLAELELRHNKEMTETLAAATREKNPTPGSVSEADVSALATHQLDARQLVESKYESQLELLHSQQRREFREWVMTVHEEYRTSGQPLAHALPSSTSSFSLSSQGEGGVMVLQESFTVTLGSQMKLMHNLRVSAARVLDLLRYPASGEEALPQRLQTSMSLYSSSLCGLVLLTPSTSSSIEAEFSSLCSRAGTEFHFPSLQQQVEKVRGELARAAPGRQELHRKKVKQEQQLTGGGGESAPVKDFTSLQTGDFYMTKHSNLCETHVVFHMVTDQSLEGGNISSRHPTIMGLRHLIKTACMCGVTSLTIPLLLSHKMAEGMTVAWCVKRAELVFKCIKGFMMEMNGWGGSDIKTMQFLLPAEIDPDVFAKLSSMLSTIFRVSNPIRGS